MRRYLVLACILTGLVALLLVGTRLEEQRTVALWGGNPVSYETAEYSVTMPDTWAPQRDDSDALTFVQEGKDFRSFLKIQSEALPREGTLKDIADASLIAIQERTAGFRLVGQDFVTIAGTFGVQNTFTWEDAANNQNVYQREVFVKHRGKVFIVTAILDAADERRENEIITNALNSFLFADVPANPTRK